MNYSSKISLIILIAILLSLASPVSVSADEVTPPTEEIETTIVQDHSTPEDTEIEPSLEVTELPTIQDNPTSETTLLPDLETESVAENLEQLPENTEIIVLDENGEAQPLVTQEAEEIILVGDPVWCPSTLSAPTPGANGCTNSYTSFQALLNYLDANEPSQAGTIWIESIYDSSVNDASSSGFSIRESFFTTMSNYALTIQGGWNGVSGDASIGSSSIFNGDFIFIEWNADITVNNISISNATGNGLTLDTTQNININYVSANNNQATGIVTSTNDNTKNVTLSNITTNDNGYNGTSISGGVLILNGTNSFNNNVWMGLDINAPKAITLNNVTANDNTSTGVSIFNYGGTEDVTINSMSTLSNGGHGLFVYSNGNVNINNLFSNGNIGFGADIYNNNGGVGNVKVEFSTFSNNEAGANIHSSNHITLSNVISNSNNYGGFNLVNTFGTGNIFVENSDFSNNAGTGIGATSYGVITLSNITSNTNAGSGANLEGYSSLMIISSSIFNSNSYYGIDAKYATSSLTLNNVSFDCLNVLGDFIYNSTVYTACAKTPTPEEEPTPSESISFALNTLLVNEGENIELDCENYSGTKLILANGNLSTFNCPITGLASLSTLENENLPAELPEGVEYVSGLVATQSPQGSDVALDSLVIISFVIPNDLIGEDLAILYWNGTEWVDLETATFDDGRTVFNGGYVSPNGYFEAFTNFVGSFVLVKK